MPIDPEKQQSLRKAADAQMEAFSEASKGIINLWRSQLDLALSLDDEDLIRNVLQRPGGETGLWDTNTNCGSGCGGGGTSGW